MLDVVALAGGNFDELGAESEDERDFGGRLIGEIEGDGGLDALQFAGPLEVDLEDEIDAGAKLPGETFGFGRDTFAGNPGEHVAGRKFGRGFHPGKSGFRIAGIEAA